ncbi:MAG TPA: alpha-1,4-glucan--maltose-1-phosphate maltosyltransferase [Herpetosiphonaceae bacterium]
MTYDNSQMPGEQTRIVIEAIYPTIECGRFPTKRVIGDSVGVYADIFRDGHDLLAAVVKYRKCGQRAWQEAPMTLIDNDRWGGSFVVHEDGRYELTVEAWTDAYRSWHRDMQKRLAAAQDVSAEILEGLRLIEQAQQRARGEDQQRLAAAVAEIRGPDQTAALDLMMNPDFAELVERYPDRSSASVYEPLLPLFVDRVRARFSAWYELFPRSYAKEPGAHGTFRDAAERLPAVREMGFDVVYLPPIHPIGRTNRKGRNNTLVAEPSDVGSPWAIGGPEGGHDAIHPQLGDEDDFAYFVDATHRLGMEVALDFAIQCSPDHPWVTQHPDWFYQRPDGSIRFAENPPKKYEDIYPVNFYGPHQQELWNELLRIVRLWVSRGVRIFRVDNPHTKSVPFWGWLIEQIQRDDPGVIFLAEAFTRPKMMRALAKAGFTQSYTYFTWRTTKAELIEYLTELTTSDMKEYYRPNFWPNTPDILHEFLQHAGPPAFKQRLVLAATLSSNYGIYSGYELCENEPRPGAEEYLDNEKYELRQRNWDQPHSIAPYIRRINQIRHEHAALQYTNNLRFVHADNDAILAYVKQSPDRSDTILTVVNLDPHHVQEATVEVPAWELGLPTSGRSFVAEDLVTGAHYTWHEGRNYVRLDPHHEPAHVLWLHRQGEIPS